MDLISSINIVIQHPACRLNSNTVGMKIATPISRPKIKPITKIHPRFITYNKIT